MKRKHCLFAVAVLTVTAFVISLRSASVDYGNPFKLMRTGLVLLLDEILPLAFLLIGLALSIIAFRRTRQRGFLRSHIALSVFLSYWAFAFAGLFGVKAIPGGPFVSFLGDIVPQILTLTAFALALVHYQSYSTPRRLLSLIIAGLALTISTFTALSTYSFFHDPYARGAFWGW